MHTHLKTCATLALGASLAACTPHSAPLHPPTTNSAEPARTPTPTVPRKPGVYIITNPDGTITTTIVEPRRRPANLGQWGH